MSLYQSYFPLVAADICVPVTLEYEQSEFKPNNAWIFGAFLLGLLFGVGVTLILVPCTLRSLAKKKEQDELELLDDKDDHHNTLFVQKNEVVHAYNIRSEDDDPKFGKKRKGKKGRKYPVDEEEDVLIGGDHFGSTDKGGDSSQPDPAMSHGIADILVQSTPEGAEAEMMKQDIDKVDRVIKDQRREKDELFLKQLQMQLRKMKVDDHNMMDLIDTVMEDIRSKAKILQDEKNEQEDEIKKQNKGTAADMENELEKLDSQLESKMGRVHEDERDFIRSELSKKTDLSEEQIDALMKNLLKDMSLLEHKMGEEFNRQKRDLEERLAKRRQILAFRKLQTEQENEEIKEMVGVMEESTQKLVDDGNMKQQQKDQIINNYMSDLQRINREHDKANQRHMQDLAEKLRLRRIKRMNQLTNKHEREKAMFLEKSVRSGDQNTSLMYHELIQQQKAELAVAETDTDQSELQQIDTLKQKLTSDKSTEIDARTNSIRKELEDAWVDPQKAEWIIELHKAQMDKLNDSRLNERKRMADKLREQWEKRMMQLDEDDSRQQQDQETLNEQQMLTVNRVLTSSVELTDDAKKRILLEHDHNMQVLNNQLEKSKIKQQRHIEYRLNQRRAKMAELRKQKEEAMLAKTKTSKAEQDKLQKQFDEEIAAQEKQIEIDRAAALAALRRRMANETEEALSRQEQELGVLIGRLEIGSARRQAVLQKQDTMIRSLEDQLEQRLATGAVQVSGADQIIMQHYNQVEHLNNQLQSSRENQEYMIKEKLQAKKLQREHELQHKMAEESQQVKNSSIRRRGAAKASDILNKLFIKQQHNRDMEDLEEEMRMELEKSKEQLNRQLEQELESELKEQKRVLLTELAQKSDMSEHDIRYAVDTAATETGASKKDSAKLAKEFRQGLQRAKTNIDDSEEDSDSVPQRRITSATSRGRPKSGLLKQKVAKQKRSSISDSPMQNTWAMSDNEEDF